MRKAWLVLTKGRSSKRPMERWTAMGEGRVEVREERKKVTLRIPCFLYILLTPKPGWRSFAAHIWCLAVRAAWLRIPRPKERCPTVAWCMWRVGDTQTAVQYLFGERARQGLACRRGGASGYYAKIDLKWSWASADACYMQLAEARVDHLPIECPFLASSHVCPDLHNTPARALCMVTFCPA